jgi:predicted AAA+ superfamily ATPase
LGLATFDDVAGHPVVGVSWEGFVIESLIAASPPGSTPLFFRTTVGAEIDLLIRLPAGELWAIEIKSGMVPKLERGYHVARADLNPARSILVYGGQERLPLGDGVEAMSVATLAAELRHS